MRLPLVNKTLNINKALGVNKATLQIGLLLLGSVLVAWLWLRPSSPNRQTDPITKSAVTSPSTINNTTQDSDGHEASVLSKKAVDNAGKHASTHSKPESVTPSLTLSTHAKARLEKADALAMAELDAQIAEAKARIRKAQAQGRIKGPGGGSVGDSGVSVPSTSLLTSTSKVESATLPASASFFDRLILRGLMSKGETHYAYLSVGEGTPKRLKTGEVWHGVTITQIDESGVQIEKNGQTRYLEGGL